MIRRTSLGSYVVNVKFGTGFSESANFFSRSRTDISCVSGATWDFLKAESSSLNRGLVGSFFGRGNSVGVSDFEGSFIGKLLRV